MKSKLNQLKLNCHKELDREAIEAAKRLSHRKHNDLKFFIARLLFHYSKINDLNWKIYLRKQKRDGIIVIK